MSCLLLVPTLWEIAQLPDPPGMGDVLAGRGRWRGVRVAAVGFGPVDAACGATIALASEPRVGSCLLAGLAGTYDGKLHPPGAVVDVEDFQLYGVGAGGEPEFEIVEEMGLPEGARGVLPAATHEAAAEGVAIAGGARVQALTVCSASGTREQAAVRRRRFPEAAIEEMEGFAVARAARVCGVPMRCLRAVANEAGDRDVARWRATEAMATLGAVLERALEELG